MVLINLKDMRNSIIFVVWVLCCAYLLQTKQDIKKLEELREKEQTIILKKYEVKQINNLTWLAKEIEPLEGY
jgi:Tfp pilus assembly protein PilO